MIPDVQCHPNPGRGCLGLVTPTKSFPTGHVSTLTKEIRPHHYGPNPTTLCSLGPQSTGGGGR